MKMVSFGVDISDNDISCSDELINNVECCLSKIEDSGAIFSRLSNITGDDIVITAVLEDDNLEKVNKAIFEVLKENALGFDDLNGVGSTPKDAGEGISYAVIDLNPNFYPDAVIIGFDTYCGESFVDKVAKSAMDAAKGMDFVGDVCCSSVASTKHIPGVGYVSSQTDDPIIIASVQNVEQVGVVAGAMMGAILGNKNTYLVRRHTPANVIPGSVIFSITAIMNSNLIDLSEPLSYRMRILEK
ncbi:hypothetical protein [Methanosphaera sp. WGK6]|uniref:hypothetical protein n=1 Tax=Methanosphaera sp. WGK6 TaxID=1561964 RepID=UPI00084CB7AC|nr:hypothetical protein [Methanosphaera sp. WGK6]OED30128.1 hypothetical protein NL43_04275 [Methanosphaera sp. WGK6]